MTPQPNKNMKNLHPSFPTSPRGIHNTSQDCYSDIKRNSPINAFNSTLQTDKKEKAEPDIVLVAPRGAPIEVLE